MNESGPAKICGLCGQDCSARPRIKDKNGKYFCKACHDQAAAQRTAGQGFAPPPDAVRPPPRPKIRPAAPSPSGDHLGLLGALLEEQKVAAPIAGASRLCAGCHQPLAPNAVICTHCGFNTASGQQVAMTMAAPIIKGGNPAWPTVIGAISLVIGAGLALIQVVNVGMQLAASGAGGLSAYNGGRLAGSTLPLLMSVWLARSGYQVLRRESEGVRNLRRWSIAQLFFCVLGIGCGALLFATIGTPKARRSGGLDPDAAAVAAVIIIVLSACFMIWPTFCLIWTSRTAVKREVESWN